MANRTATPLVTLYQEDGTTTTVNPVAILTDQMIQMCLFHIYLGDEQYVEEKPSPFPRV